MWAGAIDQSLKLENGTGPLQADLVWAQNYTIADGGTLSIDVNASLTDQFGQTITMVNVVGVTVVSKSTNTTVLTVGGGSNPLPIFAGSSTSLAPNGIFTLASPDASGIAAVTPATADLLNIVNAAGATADVEVMIVGRSA
jgi:hypothetical protein